MTAGERLLQVAGEDVGPEHAAEALAMVGDWMAQAGLRVVRALPAETVAAATVGLSREILLEDEEAIRGAIENQLALMRDDLVADVLAVKEARS